MHLRLVKYTTDECSTLGWYGFRSSDLSEFPLNCEKGY